MVVSEKSYDFSKKIFRKVAFFRSFLARTFFIEDQSKCSTTQIVDNFVLYLMVPKEIFKTFLLASYSPRRSNIPALKRPGPSQQGSVGHFQKVCICICTWPDVCICFFLYQKYRKYRIGECLYTVCIFCTKFFL